MEKLVRLRGVGLELGGLKVIGGLDFEVAPREIVALVGPSGCGKTSLLNLIADLKRPSSGSIERRCGPPAYVFQEDRLFPWLSVYENVRAANERASPREIRQLISRVGLSGFERYTPDRLSGGMRQRCAVARAYAFDGELILMDEPFSALDQRLREDLARMLRELYAERGKAIVFVTHSLDEALSLAQRLVVLSPRPARVLRNIPLTDPRLDAAAVKKDILEFCA